MKGRSTIQLPKEFIEELKELKKYSRETYLELLRRKLKRDLDAVKRRLDLKK